MPPRCVCATIAGPWSIEFSGVAPSCFVLSRSARLFSRMSPSRVRYLVNSFITTRVSGSIPTLALLLEVGKRFSLQGSCVNRCAQLQNALFMCKSVLIAAKCTVHVQVGVHRFKVHRSCTNRCSQLLKDAFAATTMEPYFCGCKDGRHFAAAISTLHRPNCLLLLTRFLFLSRLKSWRKKPISCSTLRSASGTLSLQIPRTRLNSTVGFRTCSAFGPSTWNE